MIRLSETEVARRRVRSVTAPATAIRISDDDWRRAEQVHRRFTRESLDPGELAAEIDSWLRERALWQGDLEAKDFTDHDAATLTNGIAYADQRLAELTRQAERHARALGLPGYPQARPHEDLTARFQAAKGVDLVDLAQTLTGREAIQSGNGRSRLRCPFHDDHNPSLIIYPPGKGWWCPVCGKVGDAVAFVAELRRCSAVEALQLVELLADTDPQARSAAR